MFCKWCGKKITDNSAPCPFCGKQQDALQNGNGFWNLCSQPEQAGSSPSISPSVPPAGEPESRTPPHPASRRLSPACILSAIAAALLLVLIVLAGIGIHQSTRCLALLNAEQIPEPAEPIVHPSCEKILLLPDDGLRIETHPLHSDVCDVLYLAVGDRLLEENVRLCWQRSEAPDVWKTVAVGTAFLAVQAEEGVSYRVLCVPYSDAPACSVYYAVANPIPQAPAG